MMKKITMLFAVMGLLLAMAGCSSRRQSAEEKVAELQKQLDQAQQEVEKQKASAPAEAPGSQAQGQAQLGAAPASAAQGRQPASQPGSAPASRVASSAAPAASQVAQKAAQPPRPVEVTIPAGTTVVIRTTNMLSSKTAADGSEFHANLEEDLVVGGRVVAAKGADVTGYIVSVDSGGRVKGRATLAVGLRSIAGANGQPIKVSTESHTATAKSTVKQDTVKTGIMTGVGAAIGAIAGGGKGAAIGAGAGAAAGVGTTMATRGAAAEIPAESVLTLKLAAPATAVFDK
jgi:hypothetical protein